MKIDISYMAVPGVKRLDNPKYIIKFIKRISGCDITLNTRKTEVVEARQVAMVIIKNNTRLSLSKIGSLFGRDHATVLHAAKVVPRYIEVDKQYAKFWKPVLRHFEIDI